jgi:GDP-D-mannose dehydratase
LLPCDVLISSGISRSTAKPAKTSGGDETLLKKALVTGITGQDGAYLAEFLLAKGYEVHGLARRSSSSDVNLSRLEWLGIEKKIRIVDGNLLDLSALIRTVQEVAPDEVYNLAAQKFGSIVLPAADPHRSCNGAQRHWSTIA